MSSGIHIHYSGRVLNKVSHGCFPGEGILNQLHHIRAGPSIVTAKIYLIHYFMNRFSQFNIKAPAKGFEGSKIKISKILNKEIVVHDFKIEEYKVPAFREKGSGKCLHLQISFDNEMHVVFTQEPD
jgi:hypothetical protein